ncbi:MAG: hypothetical protein E6R03_00615 [Hyphomicrobiaceae bacterium]|nr:MAG: hypothetical protein E6R03_00615 [Hyphomicrobiaceae bacterium]
MANPTVLAPSQSDMQLVKLAREIAMDILPLETILKNHAISNDRWEELQRNGKFKFLLESECEAWNTALNTHERVKLKAAAMIEEWLPELNNRLHDHDEALPAKIEGAKMLTRVAGMGLPGQVEGGTPERFTVTINLGPQVAPVTIEKDVTPRTIEHSTAE